MKKKEKSEDILNMEEDDEFAGLTSFYRLVLSPRDDLHKLEIPRKFVEEYGEEFAENVAYLRTPTKAVWKVDLARKNNRVWLQNGWPEFVEFYSISHLHFLVFNYKGRSHFDVVIFNMSACEIDYPTAGLKRKRQSTNSFALPSSNKENEGKKTIGKMSNMVIGRKCNLTPEETKKVEAYRSEHPSFVVRTAPSSVEFKHNVNLPIEFIQNYLKKERGMFTIENGTIGKTWSVRCSDTKKGKKEVVIFSSGWKDFAKDNKLQVGDICVFQLIKGGHKLFKVHIIAKETAYNGLQIILKGD